MLIEDNPFAVCIITPLMQRCHALPSAAEICFVDSTDGHLTAFVRAQGSNMPLYRHRRSAIHVQPTSIARRSAGVTRGAKRLLVGRPPNTDPIRHRTKRPRNLAYNIAHSQPNAKSHGDGR